MSESERCAYCGKGKGFHGMSGDHCPPEFQSEAMAGAGPVHSFRPMTEEQSKSWGALREMMGANVSPRFGPPPEGYATEPATEQEGYYAGEVRQAINAATVARMSVARMLEQKTHAETRAAMLEDDNRALRERLGEARAPQQINAYLGFDSHAQIAPCCTISMVNRPQVTFKGSRLFVWRETAASFMIDDVRVGNFSMPVAAGPIPADIFSVDVEDLTKIVFRTAQLVEIDRLASESVGLPFDLVTADVAADVLIRVTNVSDRPARFVCAFLGLANW